MKILLTGSNGMLGNSLTPFLIKKGHNVTSTDIDINGSKNVSYLDVRDFYALKNAVIKFKPELIMHLAAETDVDLCEQNPEHAYTTNVLGTQNVAIVCKKNNIPILYLSSVGVFDGNNNLPYIESDDPKPINIYGVTKLEGEKIVRSLVQNNFIVRAGWMFGGGPKKDKKFVGKIIKQIQNGSKKLIIVNDKIGTPTYTYALSIHLEKLINTEFWSTYHCSCKGICNRVDVAKEIIKNMHMVDKIKIKEVSSANYPLPARRPYSECMDNLMLRIRGLDEMKHWREYLREYVKEFQK